MDVDGGAVNVLKDLGRTAGAIDTGVVRALLLAWRMWRTGLMIAIVAACSTSSTPEAVNVVNGNIRGMHFAVADATAFVDLGMVAIRMSSEIPACGQTVRHPGDTVFSLGLFDTAPGTYSVTAAELANRVDVSAVVYDASCEPSTDLDAYADTGALTLTNVDADGFFGTFDVTFGGDHVTGSFAAPVCDPPSSGPTCEP
jgi:hypothetical protein